jgi:choline dehydrogenase
VQIRSDNPFESPSIQPNYLSTDLDRRTAVAALRAARAIAASPSMRPYVKQELTPGLQAKSDEELLAFCRASGATIFHPVGTCRMGADERAVVDPSLKVQGMAGLRVVDASVMPRIISGNTASPVVMIAERAADLILGRA